MSLLAICETTKSIADFASVDVWRSFTAGDGGRNLDNHNNTYADNVGKAGKAHQTIIISTICCQKTGKV